MARWASDTVGQYEQLPEAARHQRVEDEWSLAETLRHLVFATDAWAGSAILEQDAPYHRLGLTHSGYPPKSAAKLGIDIEASPSFTEVMEARADRQAVIRGILADLTDADLERECTRKPAPLYPKGSHSLGACLRVVMREEVEHRRYIVRDLATLTNPAPPPPGQQQ